MKDNEFRTMTPDEFAAEFAPAPAQTPDNYFIRNRETGKLELHFDKSTYDALDDAQKREIKSAFLWGRRSGCWISRAKEPNLWHAERVAKALGLIDAGTAGERLSFAEQQERKTERAQRRAERFDGYADSAAERGRRLQQPIENMRGDIAFFTQPNINSNAGRAFTRRRDRMFDAYEKGFKEFNKSAYYRDRAATARETADLRELRDKGFVSRRIAECESNLRKLRKNIAEYENDLMPKAQAGTLKHYDGTPFPAEAVQAQIDTWLDRMEAELDKLGYYQDALDALGGVTFSKENIKPGYVVKVQRWGDVRVLSTGPKNFTAAGTDSFALTHAYAEIVEVVSAQEETPKAHPFKAGETFTLRNGETHTIVKTTAKTVTLQDGKGNAYRATPKYRPIPAQRKFMWCLFVGHGAWAGETFYRD